MTANIDKAPADIKTPAQLEKSLSLSDRPSIAVLPFQNMSGDPEQEYFADGMVEDIITALSRFKTLFVIARNSSFTYKGKAVDIKQVGRELGVHYLLEGSVRKAGERLRITSQLIDTATGAHLWANKFDGSLADVFDLQDEIARIRKPRCSVAVVSNVVATKSCSGHVNGCIGRMTRITQFEMFGCICDTSYPPKVRALLFQSVSK
jgi:TolB-like protein